MLGRALIIGFAIVAIAVGYSSSASAFTVLERSSASASAESDFIGLVNAYRAANGFQAVSPNRALTAAATWMAADMAARNYVGHVSSDGRSPTQRMSAFGYPATSMYTGEDLGAGYETATAVLVGWQASAAHNAVLLNPNYNAVGVGLVYEPSSAYKWYWAADFGGPGGTVKVIVPAAPEAQPIAARAAAAPRGADQGSAQETVDPETEAQAARTAFIGGLGERRIAHLVALLLRMGAL